MSYRVSPNCTGCLFPTEINSSCAVLSMPSVDVVSLTLTCLTRKFCYHLFMKHKSKRKCTCTGETITEVSRITGAVEAVRYVVTSGMFIASSVVHSAFIHICVLKHRRTALYWLTLILIIIITALHAMQTWSSDEKAVCLSVCQTRELWQDGRKSYPDIYTIRKII